MAQKTYLFCIGTAAEVVKTMPVYRLLKEEGNRVHILQTGFADPEVRLTHQIFNMVPDNALDKPVPRFPDAALLASLEETLTAVVPDVLIVEDGSATAGAAALVAYSRNIPVAHLDAGLRSHAENPPYFEKNQELIARLAHWHFTATEQAKCNLLEEDISPTRAFEVGSTLVDAAIWTREHLHASTPGHIYSFSPELREFLFQCRSRRLVVAVTENPQLQPQAMGALAHALNNVIEKYGDCLAVWVTPPNCQANAEAAIAHCTDRERIRLAGPQSFPALVELATRCSLMLTDSDYIEQVASTFYKPVLLTVDDQSGHQELIKAGGARFVGTGSEIAGTLEALLGSSDALRAMQLQTSPYGDGNAARRIVDILEAVK